ncbi:hypothetical protein FHW67_003507 [Herbaspirillum sp. Sphag1AN]|uniref:hypothetical protein n=1 Tax=unclassified Herbaspirillum TaxID=2624150 RepID=UPI001618C48B|nr:MULTISPECIES: hypothetical protein [unclassified Herbaspirillum]MBB3214195.1 hypothetical protein [Herbaspirillum sp. Sphag1AN]MBB3247253.1 hypothetical protein [Herbaspirillum sp. Sphag64]
MIHHINLDDDTSELLQAHTMLTGLTDNDLINRLLSAHVSELHELLALVNANSKLREQAANLLLSFGPESLSEGIKRIAPSGYRTLGEQFDCEVAQLIASPRKMR